MRQLAHLALTVHLVMILVATPLACAKSPPRKPSTDAEHLTPATLPPRPAIHAEVYIPVYSSLSYASGRVAVELSAQLTIRNTDSQRSIILESVKYFDGSGKLLRDELREAQSLGPMATTSFLVRKSDSEGGVGANYLVRWRSQESVSEPLMEAAMADLSSSHSLAFTSRGVTTRRADQGTLSP